MRTRTDRGGPAGQLGGIYHMVAAQDLCRMEHVASSNQDALAGQ